MRLLILGGTLFLGRALFTAAQSRGHDVTLFNRGKTNPDLFPDVHRIVGDRRTDQSALTSGTWDAAIDTSGHIPRTVGESARLLSDRVGHYTFVSTLSVYSDNSIVNMDEHGPLCTMEESNTEEMTMENYGAMKVLCERAAENAMPGRVCVVRPGLIVGPHVCSDRGVYWPVRIAKGGDVLAPGRPERPIQFIDVRDLAEWMITVAEQRVTGIFNANGFDRVVTMGEYLNACNAVGGNKASLKWTDEKVIAEHGISPWIDLPLWLPEDDPDSKGFFTIRSDKAIAAGLKFRSIEDTVWATLVWNAERPADRQWRAGITGQKEREVLDFSIKEG